MRRLVVAAITFLVLASPQRAAAQIPPPDYMFRVTGLWCISAIGEICFDGSWYVNRTYRAATTDYLFEWGSEGIWSGFETIPEYPTAGADADLYQSGAPVWELGYTSGNGPRAYDFYIESTTAGTVPNLEPSIFVGIKPPTGPVGFSCGGSGDGACRTFRVPEPGTMALLGSGILGLLGVGIRRRREQM